MTNEIPGKSALDKIELSNTVHICAIAHKGQDIDITRARR
jgi:hypothetical protein